MRVIVEGTSVNSMGHIPYGYKIENGKAAVDEEKAKQIRTIYREYLSGLSLTDAAKASGMQLCHTSVKRIMQNQHYLGDEYYPAIIDPETFQRAFSEQQKRAAALGRVYELKKEKKPEYNIRFTMKPIMQQYTNPFQQAEYAYSLIESEVVADGSK
jgi:hypothetical protein